MPINPQENFKSLLKELFQLDKTDLDFGIYRIINNNQDKILEFINKELPKTLNEVKSTLAARGLEEAKEQLEKAKKKLETDFKVDFTDKDDLSRKADQYGQLPLFQEPYKLYLEAKDRLDHAELAKEVENDIYNELYRFFNRYYDEGDFVTKPRSGDNAYMIPYNGEEVKLYWANYDQYYIKTGENFKNYTFSGEGVTVEFRLVEAETPSNNNQAQKGRLFVPAEKWFHWNPETKKLEIHFYYKVPDNNEKKKWGAKQSVKKDNKGINENLVFNLLGPEIAKTGDPDLARLWGKRTKKIGKDTVQDFHYHLHRYTSLNKSDYFIHKDLKKFLEHELDYFLKNEVFHIDFLNPGWDQEQVQKAIEINVVKSGAIRTIAFKIIDFLHELENFQKRLFEKKKFVVKSDYCLTLDRIPEAVYDEMIDFILKDKDQKQLTNWVELGFVESTDISKDHIEQHDKLVMDTAFLPASLKYKLLHHIENLDEETGGLLINSENWQGLNIVIKKYRNCVDYIHIDPPYNTSTSGFLYKNNYKHSSWLNMIHYRAILAIHLMSPNSCFQIHIDENEYEYLNILLNKYNITNQGTIIWDKRNPVSGTNRIATQHEYILTISKGDIKLKTKKSNAKAILNKANELIKTEGEINSAVRKRFKKWLEEQDLFTSGEKAYSNIDNEGRVYQSVHMGAPEQRTDPKFFKPLIHPISKKPCPVPKSGWSGKPEFMQDLINKNEIIFGIDEKTQPRRKYYLDENLVGEQSSLIYFGKKGKANLIPMGLEFPYNHNVELYYNLTWGATNNDQVTILDYFAGSATTGHAVLKMNKDDGGKRKYILMEVGEYFNFVTKPRIQKVMYSQNWKNGKPKDMDGSSHMFQYLKLEQYEDTLNNIEFSEMPGKANEFSFGEQIRYLFNQSAEGSPSLLNIQRFTTPFDYEMDIVELNERKRTTINLVTTFNFLLGIFVKRYLAEEHQREDYRIILGEKDKQQYAVVWRNFTEKLDLEKERNWIKRQEWHNRETRIFCNADNMFGAESTEKEFLRLMWEGTDHE